MFFLNSSSIINRVQNLILLTILFLVTVTCSLAVLLFGVFFEDQHVKYLESALKVIHAEVLENSLIAVHEEVQQLSKLPVQEASDVVLGHQSHMSQTGAYLNANGGVLSSNLPAVCLSQVSRLVLEHGDMEGFAGNNVDGIFVYSIEKVEQTPSESPVYLVVCRPLEVSKAVSQLKEQLGIDVTIFYKDIRIATTVVKEQKNIQGTRLAPELAKNLLSREAIFSGRATIQGMPYLTAYKSFGNLGEAPFGIIFAGESLSVYHQTIINLILWVLLLGVVLFTISRAMTTKWLERTLVSPILQMTDSIVGIADSKNPFQEYKEPVKTYSEFDKLKKSVFRILEELYFAKQAVEKIAYNDELTGLPNRYSLCHRFEKGDYETSSLLTISTINLNDFKQVNDLYGRRVGDLLLLSVADYLGGLATQYPTLELMRMEGSEFALLSKTSVGDFKDRVIPLILDRFDRPFLSGQNSLNITVSIGIAQKESDASISIESLLQKAEIAMREARACGKNCVIIFTESISSRMKQRKEMESDLERAILNDEIFLVYQPKLDLDTNECLGFEALVRWECPKRGLVAPNDFIGIAEESGLIIPLGKRVLEDACRMVKKQRDASGQPYRVAVNVSALQVNREDFFRSILNILTDNQLPPEALELEITESLLMSSFSSAVETLRKLFVMGVGIALDDFGKGYSSLAYLQYLPIGTLKIDKLFIDSIGGDGEVLVEDIVRLGHRLGMKVVAEGVETQEQMTYIQQSGCDMVQGYWFSKPLRGEELQRFLG